MEAHMTKKYVAAAAAAILLILGLTGCQTAKTTAVPKPAPVKTVKIRLGVLPVEDALPIFTADQKGFFKKNHLEVEVVNFQSALECDAAFQAGKIDGFMGDVVGAALLKNAGFDVSIVTTVLGATAKEGRFAIVAAPKSGITTVGQLKNVPIGTASNTVIDYVIHESLSDKGFKADEIKTIEVKKLPVRLQMLLGGQLQAAGLPNLMVVLAEKQGAKIIVDDTQGPNLSQTIVLFKTSFVKSNLAGIERFLLSLNQAATAINKDPKSFRALLVSKANLPPTLAATYVVSKYPAVGLPKEADVDRLLKWMKDNKTIKNSVTYSGITMEVKAQ
jgi:NitT/TauT family transport system substrate-binding protein